MPISCKPNRARRLVDDTSTKTTLHLTFSGRTRYLAAFLFYEAIATRRLQLGPAHRFCEWQPSVRYESQSEFVQALAPRDHITLVFYIDEDAAARMSPADIKRATEFFLQRVEEKMYIFVAGLHVAGRAEGPVECTLQAQFGTKRHGLVDMQW